MNTLCIEGLSKRFGSHTVLDHLTFSVPKHSVFGFLGPNGAGKTTTMKLILGLLRADAGTIRILDEPVFYGRTKTNRHVGYLPDVPEFYGYMRPMEYLRLCGEIAGLSKNEIVFRSNELLELVGLSTVKKKIKSFSRGMKQRLGIAQALLGNPKLLICDEPTSALDPVGRKEILEILRQVKGTTTVVFSTHILSDAERICDHIAVLYNNRLALHGNLRELKEKKARDVLFIRFATPAQLSQFAGSPLMLPYRKAFQEKTSLAICSKDMEQLQKAVMSALSREELFPIQMEIQEPSLESLFMEVVK